MDFYSINLQGFVHEINLFSFTKPTKCTYNIHSSVVFYHVYDLKNTKHKLFRTNTAVWFNKMCGVNRLTPKYMHKKRVIKDYTIVYVVCAFSWFSKRE
jgi:hypothetical protein